MADYNPYFTGSPCRYDWYNELKRVEFARDRECTIFFSISENRQSLSKTAMVTNCPVTDTATAASGYSYGNPTDYFTKEIPVYNLVSFNMDEELDETNRKITTPNCSVVFSLGDGNHFDSISDVSDLVDNLTGQIMEPWLGFCDINYQYPSDGLGIRDENGRMRWPYDNDSIFSHDINKLGNFIVTDVDIDYTSGNITAYGESYSVTEFSRASSFRGFLSKAQGKPLVNSSAFASSSVPIPGGSFYYQYGLSRTFSLGHTFQSILFGRARDAILGITAGDIADNPRKNYTLSASSMVLSAMWAEKVSGGGTTLNPNAAPFTPYISLKETADDISGSEETFVLRSASPTSRDSFLAFSYATFSPGLRYYRVAPLYHSVGFERYIDYINALGTLNDLWRIPMNRFENTSYRIISGRDSYFSLISGSIPAANFDGTALTVSLDRGTDVFIGGEYPDDKVFVDTSKWVSGYTIPDNGHFFPQLGEKYYITPSMLILDSVTVSDGRSEIYDAVTYDYIDLYNYRDVSYESYASPSYARYTGNVDIDVSSAYKAWPAKANDGSVSSVKRTPLSNSVDFVDYGTQPLSGDKWYHPDAPTLISSSSDNYKDEEYYPLSYTIKTPWNGGVLHIPRWIYSSQLPYLGSGKYRPYSIALPSKEFSKITVNENDEQVTSVNSYEFPHGYHGYRGIAKRILNRVNNVNIPRKYTLTWKMKDDPSLRIGTCVYVPLYSEYVKVFITKKRTAFNGGCISELEGCVMELTGEKIFEIYVSNSRGRYPVNDDDPAVTFNWRSTATVSPNTLIEYTVFYEGNSGGYIPLKTDSFTYVEDNAGYATSMKLSEMTAILGYKPDLEGGWFYIQGRYAEVTSDYASVVMSGDSTDPYVIYSEQIEANNQPLPLMNGHWFIG